MRKPVASLLVLLTGCVEPDEEKPTPHWDPDGQAFVETPWPTDLNLREDGTLDLHDFVNPYDVPIIETYLGHAEAMLDGWGPNSAVYVRFDDPLDRSELPTALESVEPDSPLVLMDVDPASPYRGERIPMQWHFQEETTSYEPSNLLAVAPVFGFPMRPGTTYALVVTTDIAHRHPEFSWVWNASHDLHEHFVPLAETWAQEGGAIDEIAVATVFTTARVLDEMQAMADHVDSLPLPFMNQGLDHVFDRNDHQVHVAYYEGPLYQHGERPYASKEGGFLFEEDGTPVIHSWETMQISVCLPHDLSDPPPGGWPVAIQGHGTGGDAFSHCRSHSELEVAAQLVQEDIISIGFDHPLHGIRATPDTDPAMHSFNYFNPEAARANFQQGAIDILYLARVLSSQDFTFKLDDRTHVNVDPDRVLYVGHSHGGLTGAIALPWLGRYAQGAVLSGAGGGMSMTVLDRKDIVDIEALLADLLQMGPHESLHELHPVVTLVQMMVDVSDPLNYAPYWFAESRPGIGPPVPVLLTSGLLDEMTPHRTAEAMAVAGRVPQIAPRANAPAGFDIRGLDELSLPAQGNAPARDGTAVTAGLSQWPDEGHFPLFREPELGKLYRVFLATAAEGRAELVSP